jgi:hypothetical protein
MYTSMTPKLTAVSALLASAGGTFAHEGHGLSGGHWHATDVAGFVALSALVAFAVWLLRGGK